MSLIERILMIQYQAICLASHCMLQSRKCHILEGIKRYDILPEPSRQAIEKSLNKRFDKADCISPSVANTSFGIRTWV
jgi:hypothetical protein